ncbi:MAG: hypothetical protein GXY36_05065 [Chloroflexi bacterium]|nr:hypothetical protein [Chloroflexota bacterium]
MYWKRMLQAVGVGVLVVGLLPAGVTLAQSGDGVPAPVRCEAVARGNNVNVRNGPDTQEYFVLGVLPEGEALPVVGMNQAGDWYAVSYTNQQGQPEDQAWIAADIVTTRGTCERLPALPDPGPPPAVAELMNVPVLPTLDAENLRAIFERGQALGNDPRAFTKVGDCNTDTGYFLAAFDQDLYDLGPYDALEPTIEYFQGWYEHVSLAGQVGYNALTMLENLWADPKLCAVSEGESVLACEFRRTNPSVVVIMFGPNDMLNLSEAQFREALIGNVELALDEGIIPVLTTFTWHHDRMWQTSLAFNLITVEVAEEYGIPLINFWRAAQDLPNYGLVADYTHLTESGFGVNPTQIVFRGQETTSGYALRNLLTLQVLDMLRREVLAPDPA